MKKFSLLCCFVLFFCIGTAMAKDASVGGTRVRFADPAGYVEATNDNYAGKKETWEKIFADRGQLLAGYLSQEDAAAIAKNPEAAPQRYVLCVAPQRLAATTLNPAQFSQVRKGMHTQFQKALQNKEMQQKASDRARAVDGSDITIKAEKTAPGVISESDTHIAYLVVQNIAGKRADGTPVAIRQGCATIMLYQNSKIFLVNFYRPLQSDADLDAIKQEVLAYLKQ